MCQVDVALVSGHHKHITSEQAGLVCPNEDGLDEDVLARPECGAEHPVQTVELAPQLRQSSGSGRTIKNYRVSLLPFGRPGSQPQSNSTRSARNSNCGMVDYACLLACTTLDDAEAI